MKSLQERANAIARVVELAEIQYQQGLIDFQRLPDSQRTLVQRKNTLAESHGNVALNLVALYKALGGGWRMRCTPYPMEMHGDSTSRIVQA